LILTLMIVGLALNFTAKAKMKNTECQRVMKSSEQK
jgi:hypothetical protein